MTVKTIELQVDKREEDLYVTDVTDPVGKFIAESNIKDGIATIFIGCTTASITTLDYEPGTLKEMKEVLERMAPSGLAYEHHKVGDDNGKSHIRSALIGPSVTIPFTNKKLLLGEKQHIVVLDFDIIKRKRKVTVQIMGE